MSFGIGDIARVVGGVATGGLSEAGLAAYNAVDGGGDSGGGGTANNGYGKTGNQYLQLLNAYQAGMPQLLNMQQTYQPQYTADDLQNFQNALLGQNGQPGYLDIYQNELVPAMTQAQTTANTATRTANANDLANLGPSTLTALQGVNPGQTALMNSLTKSATNQLQLGTQIDPDAMNQINSMVLGNWANRGLGTSNPAQLDQALQLYGGGQSLLQQRQATAGNVAGMNQSYYTDPIMQMLGLTSQAPSTASSLGGAGTSFGSSTGNILPTDDALSMLGGAYTNVNNQSTAAANRTAALEGAGISAAGSLLSAGFKAAA